MSRPTRYLLAALLVGAGLGGWLAVANEGGNGRGAAAKASAALAPSTAAPRSETPATFAYLTGQHSNRCDLQAAEITRYPASMRIQGSCCSPMDAVTYRRHLQALRPYAQIREIPRNPYDIPARLAQQLLRYRSTRLSANAQAVYDRAMRRTHEHGPCCCRCWRWEAFKGMSRYLVARRHWQAPQLARLIEAVDGCGGPAPTPGQPS
jgi:hypothetical protein